MRKSLERERDRHLEFKCQMPEIVGEEKNITLKHFLIPAIVIAWFKELYSEEVTRKSNYPFDKSKPKVFLEPKVKLNNIFLFGISGSGKTFIINLLFKHFNIKACYVQTRDDFKYFDASRHSCIWLDDFSLSNFQTNNWNAAELLRLNQTELTRNVRVRNGYIIQIPRNVPIIWTANRPFIKLASDDLFNSEFVNESITIGCTHWSQNEIKAIERRMGMHLIVNQLKNNDNRFIFKNSKTVFGETHNPKYVVFYSIFTNKYGWIDSTLKERDLKPQFLGGTYSSLEDLKFNTPDPSIFDKTMQGLDKSKPIHQVDNSPIDDVDSIKNRLNAPVPDYLIY